MAIASMVLGIIAVVIAVFGGMAGAGWVGSVCGILAIIFGAIANKKNKTGTATAGVVLGIISLCWGIIVTIACVACGLAFVGSLAAF